MSGPKSASYTVDWAAANARIELAQARASAAAWARRVTELEERIAETERRDGELSLPGRSSAPVAQAVESAEGLRAHADRLRDHHARLSGAFDRAVAERAAERGLAAARGDVADIRAGTAADVLDRRGVGHGQVTASSRSGDDEALTRLRAEADRLMSRLPAGAEASTWERAASLRALVDRAESPSGARTAADQLRVEVEESCRAAEAAAARRTRAQDLLSDLADAGVDDPSLEARLVAVLTGLQDLDDVTRFTAERTLAAASDRREAAFVSDAVADVLQGLGYRVEQGFDTVFLERGHAHFRRREWGDHAVRIRLDAARDELSFNVVREDGAAAGDRERDRQVEDSWCSELPTLLSALASRGVDATVRRHTEPGQLPVQRVASTGLPRADAPPAPRRRPRDRRREQRS